MHFKNGREAKNGDKVVVIDEYNKTFRVGILYDAQAGNDYCNGKVAAITSSDYCPNLKETMHYDDFIASVPPEVMKRAV